MGVGGGGGALEGQDAVEVSANLLRVATLQAFPVAADVQVLWVLAVQVDGNIFPPAQCVKLSEKPPRKDIVFGRWKYLPTCPVY